MKRTRKLLASLVALMLMLQLASPLVNAAQNEASVATPVVEATATSSEPTESTPAESTPGPAITPAPMQQRGVMPLAAAVPATFTNVWVVEESIAACGINNYFNVRFELTVADDADAGQTFTLALPTGSSSIAPVGGGFTAASPYELRDNDGNLIATGVLSGNVITFTLTDFIDSGVSSVTAEGNFDARFTYYGTNPPAGPCGTNAALVFTPSAGGPFTDHVSSPPVGAPPVKEYKNGYWISGQHPTYGQIIRWGVATPVDIQVGSTFTITDTVNPATAGWQFLCDSPAHQPWSNYAGMVGSVTVVSCSPSSLTVSGVVTGTPVPGIAPRIDFYGVLTDQFARYDNTASISYVNGQGVPSTASPSGYILRPGAGSGGAFLTVVAPAAPTIQVSACVSNTVTQPTLTIPANTSTISYALTSGPETVGESVVWTLTATVTSATHVFSASTIATNATWTMASQKLATLTVTEPLARCPGLVEPGLPQAVASVCTANGVSDPTVTAPANTAEVTYAVAAPVISGDDYTFSITATLVDPANFIWDEDQLGDWTLNADNTLTWSQTLTRVKCEVAPGVPTSAASVCTDDVASDPTVTAPVDTASVTYAASAPVVSGSTYTFTVTATIADPADYVWDTANMGDWTVNGDGTASWTTTLTKVKCSATLELPVVTASVCDASNVATEPTAAELADTDSIDYEMTSNVDGSVYTFTYTATPLEGFEFNAADMGEWTLNEDGTATYDVTAEKTSCLVELEIPIVVESACVDGTVTEPTVTAPTSTGEVTYTISGPTTGADGMTWVVTATAADGYVLRPMGRAAGPWVITSDTTAEYTVVLEMAVCPTETPVTPTETPTETPVTPTETPTTPAATPVVPTVTPTTGGTPPPVSELPQTGSGAGVPTAMLVGVLGTAAVALVGLAANRRKVTG